MTENVKHTHTNQSMTLTHAHKYGDREHGYFGHPEDGVDLSTRPQSVPPFAYFVPKDGDNR